MIETGEVGASPKMPPEIAAAIIAVKKGIAQLGFDERNEHARYSYASVDKFYTAVRPLESEAGLSVMLDETAFDVREGAPNKQGERASWAFLTYDVWLVSAGGVMWGPARRHWAGPVTGPQTFGAAESYVRKAFMRGLYMVPTGEKDGDELAARDDAPVTKGVTRAASPRPANAAIHPVTSAAAVPSPSSAGETLREKAYRIRRAMEIAARADVIDDILRVNAADLALIRGAGPQTYAGLIAYAEQRKAELAAPPAENGSALAQKLRDGLVA